MPFQMTVAQLAELQTLRDTFTTPTSGNTLDYAVLYDKILWNHHPNSIGCLY